MKNVLLIGLLIFSTLLHAQNVGINTNSPDASAMLDITSTDKGLLIPRLTNSERDNMDLTGSPESVLIFNTTEECLQTYVDNDWRTIWCKNCAASISTQPSAVTGCDNSSVGFLVITSGHVKQYKWYKDNVLIAGESQSMLQIDNISSSDAGDYHVKIVGRCNELYSDTVSLTISSSDITAHPTDQTVSAGGNATFTFTVTGSGLTYEWQESVDGVNWTIITNGGIYSGATTASLTLTGVTSGMDGNQYRCSLSTTCDGLTDAATLNVN